MRLFLCVLLLFFSIFSINGYDASVCTGLHISLASFIPTGFKYIFKYSADISLAAADESHTTLTFTNQTTWTLDQGNYFQWSPIQFLSDYEVFQCPSINNGPCTLKVYDSYGLLEIPLVFNGTYKEVVLNKNLFFDQGTVFLTNSKDFKETTFLNKSSPCILTDGSPRTSKKNADNFLDNDFEDYVSVRYVTTVKYCCTQFEDLPIPDTQETCQQLDGDTVFYDKDGNSVADISYSFAPGNPSFLSSSYVTPKSLPSDSRYAVRLNYNSIKDCDYYSLDAETCYVDIPFDEDFDIQANLQLSVLSNDFSYVPYGPITVGKIIFRNGMLIKNQNELYTSNEPCRNQTFALTNGGTAKNSLCCSKFLKITCDSYQSTTSIFDSNLQEGFLDLAYLFSDTSFVLTINSYNATLPSTITVKSFSHDTSTQTCQASTAVPRNTCTLKLSKTKTYDISFSTNVTTHDFSLETIIYDGKQVTSPAVGVRNPCTDLFASSSRTRFCCVN